MDGEKVDCHISAPVSIRFKTERGNNPGESLVENVAVQMEKEDEVIILRAPRKSISAPRVYKSETFREISTSSDSSEEGLEEDALADEFCYFEDDAADKRYRKVCRKDPKFWWCEICGQTFRNPYQFVSHHRRHVSPELFRCPVCDTGFVDLNCCYSHEMQKHGKKTLDMKWGNGKGVVMAKIPGHDSSGSVSGSGASGVSEDSGLEADCPETCRTIPSTSLQPYLGPPVTSSAEAIRIEEKFGKHSRPILENFRRLRRMNLHREEFKAARKNFH